MSAARLASDDRSIGGTRMTEVAVGTMSGTPAAAVCGEAGGELGALETGRVGTGTGTLGTDMAGTETCTLGTEPDMLGTETCTLGTVPDAETGTVGVETWGAGSPLRWDAAGAEEDGAVDGAAEVGVDGPAPAEAAGPGDTAAAPVAECGAAAGVDGAMAAAPDALDATPATDGAGTDGTATPPTLAAVSTACCAAERPAWASELGLTVVTSARASCGSAHASAAAAIAIALRHAPGSRRPRLTIVYDGPRGMFSFAQVPTPIRSPARAGLIRATTPNTPGTIALVPPKGERAEVDG